MAKPTNHSNKPLIILTQNAFIFLLLILVGCGSADQEAAYHPDQAETQFAVQGYDDGGLQDPDSWKYEIVDSDIEVALLKEPGDNTPAQYSYDGFILVEGTGGEPDSEPQQPSFELLAEANQSSWQIAYELVKKTTSLYQLSFSGRIRSVENHELFTFAVLVNGDDAGSVDVYVESPESPGISPQSWTK